MRILLTTFFTFLIFAGQAQDHKSTAPDTIPKPFVSNTRGTVQIEGKTISYTADIGRMEIQGPDRKPLALFGYTAYNVESKKTDGPNTERPIVFAFNGGPGSSSVWLHMGALGPRRVVVNDPNPTPNAPYTIENNGRSILDVADLVMIDPVGTGVSVPAGTKQFKDFWGVDEDIESVSAFIKQYLIKTGRMNSPKYLLGESYGTFRNAGIMAHMQQGGIAFNGVIMVSAVFDLLSLVFPKGTDLSYIVHLPSYASTAWYHDKLKNRPDSLAPFIDRVRRFTEEVYVPALYKGSRLSANEKKDVADSLARYTGLSAGYWMRADLRVEAGEYFAELLRDEGGTVGRLDSRYRGINQNLLSQTGEYDPFTTSLRLPYTAAFLEYCYETLKLEPKHEYHISAYSKDGFKWNWEHRGNKSWGTNTSITTATDMARTLTRNPYTKVLILNGYFDLGTPFYAVEHTIDHMGLAPEIRENIQMTYYEAGHMMYTDEASFDQMERDIKDFIRDSSNN